MNDYKWPIAIGMASVGIASPSWALPTVSSLGSEGIDALRLHQAPYNLTGKKISIGQVEIGRPGRFGWDKMVQDPKFDVERVFYQDGDAKPNKNVAEHAMMVASVIKNRDKKLPGVAPDARLYSSAVGSLSQIGQQEECLAIQHVAKQNGGDIRAINMSFGEPLARDPRPQAQLDGNALLTQCLDWSARTRNMTYVVAGNQGKGGISIPTDNYNGINVAYSTPRDGVYRKLDFSNLSEAPTGTAKKLAGREVNIDNRRSISLVAPGGNLQLYNLSGKPTTANGTSFAVPHVTGTIALLQEFSDRQLRSRHTVPDIRSHWSLDARRHEVMKAVLLNSADKIQDTGDGLRLGMTRTVLAKNNRDWTESEAAHDPHLPLDYQLGAGQLHAFRAYQQFSPGQYQPTAPIPAIGWDYRTVKAGEYRDYLIDRPLAENSWFSATIAWDRLVELQDTNGDGEYNSGESFIDRGLNQLDLYLLPADEDRLTRSIWSSTSSVDSVQHIFHQVRRPGKYKIRVHFRRAVNLPKQAYGLAWWTVPGKS